MPTGWVPKATAPERFNVGQAAVALLTGQPDSWLTNWVYLLEAINFDTAEFCESVDLTPPTLEIDDFLGIIPLSRPSWMGVALAAGMTAFQLREKIMHYVQARIGAAYCMGPPITPSSTTWTVPVCAAVVTPNDSNWRVHAYPAAAPTGATRFRISFTAVSAGSSGGCWWYPATSQHLPSSIRSFYSSNPWGTPYDEQDWPGAGPWEFDTNGPVDLTYCISWNYGSPPVLQAPTTQAAPAGLPAPSVGTYTTIADLGAELDRQEHKLELIRDILTYMVDLAWTPTTTASPPVPVTEAEIPVEHITGIIVSVSSIPASVSEIFGDPPKYHGLGRVTMGTTSAWLPSVDISQNPMVILAVPPTVTRVAISVRPPATATYTLLH